MRLLVLFAVCVTLTHSLPAFANHKYVPRTCFDRSRVVSQVLRKSPGSEVRYDLAGDEAKSFLTGFNAIPPASSYTADEVLIFTMPQQPTHYWMILIKDDCATHRGKIAIEKAQKLIPHAQTFL